MAESAHTPHRPRRRVDRPSAGDAPPVYTHEAVPGVPPVQVQRLAGHGDRSGDLPPAHAHAHDFLVLTYFERGGGWIGVGGRRWPVAPGDAFVIAPGEVVTLGAEPDPLREAEGWSAAFPVEVLSPGTPGAFLSWRTHPLLLPFVRGADGAGVHHVAVPAAQRDTWTARFATLQAELQGRRDGYEEAVLAHLTLLLVDVARLAADVVADLRLRDEPLLADVFAVIEARYSEPVSLRDVAAAVSLTPGHLTTVVRQRTGRTVGDWIAERRMAEARRLLVETDLAVDEIGRRVGFRDPAYFARQFRRAHGTSPARWRRAARPPAPPIEAAPPTPTVPAAEAAGTRGDADVTSGGRARADGGA